MNYFSTTTNAVWITIAEIHGIVEDSPNTNTSYSVPGMTNFFWFSITNRGNIAETNLIITLTNFSTNSGFITGNWKIGLMTNIDLSTPPVYVTNSGNFIFSSYRDVNPVPPDQAVQYIVFLVPASNTDPGAWASIDFHASLSTTNVAYYSNFGGMTNIYRTCKVSFSIPYITLSKEIVFITNRDYNNKAVMPGCEITYRIFFSNSGQSAGTNFKIIDILPLTNIMLTNDFTTNNFAVNFNIEISRDNGFSWLNKNSLSGWDNNVDQIRFTTPAIIYKDEFGYIEYRIRIK